MIRNFTSTFVILETEERTKFYREALGENVKILTGDAISAHFLKIDQTAAARLFIVEGALNWIHQRLIMGVLPGSSTVGGSKECSWLFLLSDDATPNLSLSESLNELFGSSWLCLRRSLPLFELQQYVRMHLKLLYEASPARRYQRISQILRGLGHEFSNVLFKIGARAELAGNEEDLGRVHKQLEGLLQSVEGGAKLVQALHTVPRQALNLGVYNVTDLLEQTLGPKMKQYQESQGPQITLIRKYKEVPLVWCDPAAMSLVFSSLFSNALRALPGGGELEVLIGAEKQHQDEGAVVFIQFRDSGVGISPANLPRIFDYGFSAWEEKELGLGLSISRDIVEAHGGSLRARSEPGKGASFTIALPMVLHCAESLAPVGPVLQ